MATHRRVYTADQLALLGLWSVPGIGAKSVEIIRRAFGSLAAVLNEPVRKWVARLRLPGSARAGLSGVEQVAPLAERVIERAERGQMGITFRGEPGYPTLLAEVGNSPPVLFYRGERRALRRRVAMVGSRRTLAEFESFARRFAATVASTGVGVVSGAAEGVDTACHLGAIDVGGETWAFVGSALDELDPLPAATQEKALACGGAFFSELPPGVRAEPSTFPRRNRLISGAADVVLVMRAGEKSGALYTAGYAIDQGRPLLALPGDAGKESVLGNNRLIRAGRARICIEESDVFEALRLGNTSTLAPPGGEPVCWDEVSEGAKSAFSCLRREPMSFEDVLAGSGMESGPLAAALCELELLGLVIQRSGKRYEKL